MKNTLITLDTDRDSNEGTEGILKALFNEDIIIAPYSEMALQSASINRSISIIDITSYNNEIKFQIQDQIGLHTIFLDEGNYTQKNFLNLFNDVQVKMNKELTLAGSKETGSQVVVRIVKDEKVAIELGYKTKISVNNNTNPELSYHNVSTVTTDGGYVKNQNGTTTGLLNDNYLFCKTEFIKGCGFIRCQVKNFANGTTATPAGFILGLVENTAANQEKLNKETIAETDFTYAIRSNEDNLSTSNYQIKRPGTNDYTTTDITPASVLAAGGTDNDMLEIQISGGKLRIVRHVKLGANPTTDEAYSEDYDFGTVDGYKKYMAVIGIYGDSTTTRLRRVEICTDPFDDRGQLDFPAQTEELGFVPDGTTNQNSGNTAYNIIFDTLELANYFGYHNLNQNPDLKKTNVGSFTANNLFSKNIGTNTYLVELLNIPLESYHTAAASKGTNNETGGGRKSILSSIPISERIINNSGQIQYEPNTLFYVSLNNKFPINLRNIKARIVSNDFSPIVTEGISEISILIREPPQM